MRRFCNSAYLHINYYRWGYIQVVILYTVLDYLSNCYPIKTTHHINCTRTGIKYACGVLKNYLKTLCTQYPHIIVHVFIYLPSHLVSATIKPGGQWHLYDPGVLMQSPSQPPLFVKHSFTSTRNIKTIKVSQYYYYTPSSR